MAQVSRLGLGCMGMNMSNRDRSVETVRYALDHGVTLLNTGEFYGGGESEMVLREALRGVPRDSYFLSVKFGVLPQPGGGIYGLDVRPFDVKAHLAYSLHRLGLDYVDLYQPARMDESVPVEELMGALEDCVREGYVGSVGLTQVPAATLARAAEVQPIRMVELEYSLANRDIERNGVLDVARERGIDVLAFGVLAHGLFSDGPVRAGATDEAGRQRLAAFQRMREAMVAGLRPIARDKGTGVERLAQAYVFAKHPEMHVLIGTTRPEHLQDAIEAQSVELSAQDVRAIEAALPPELTALRSMRNFAFRDGRIVGR